MTGRMSKLILSILMVTAAAAVSSDYLPDYTQFTLENGFRVVMIEDHQQPTVTMAVLFRTGPSSDPPELAGRAILTGYIMKETTRNFPGNSLLEAIDSVGGWVDAIVQSKDALIFEGDFLSRDIGLALWLMSDIVINPVFTEEGLQRMVRRLVSINKQTRSVAEYRLSETLHKRIFGECGYGSPILGTQSSLESITLEDVGMFHQDHIRPENAVMVIGGDFKPESVRGLVSRHFSSWKKGGKRLPVSCRPMPHDSLSIYLIDNPSIPSANFMIGLPGTPVGSKDFPVMLVLNYLLGGSGRISRLHRSLVEDKELASMITSELDWSHGEGLFRIYGASPSDITAQTISQALEVVSDLRKIRIPQKELDEALYYFQGYAPTLYENVVLSIDQFVRFLSMNVDLPYQQKILTEINGLTPLAIQAAAEKYLAPEKMTIVVIGPQTQLLPSLSPLGPVEMIGLEED